MMGKKKPAEQQQDHEIKYLEDVILREYDVRSIKKIKGGPGVWKVITDRGTRFLKLSKCNKAELDFTRQLLEHITNRGFRRVARFIVTKYGDNFVHDKDNLYYMTDWIEGKECNFSKLPNLEEAVFTLAEFHQASEQFQYRNNASTTLRNEPLRQEWGIWQKIFEERARGIQEAARYQNSSRGNHQLVQLLAAKASGIYAWAVQATRLLEQAEFAQLVERDCLKQTISHRSYTGSNIIISKYGRGSYVVDMDHCVYDIQIHDLARLLGRVLPRYQWDITIAKQVLDWYGQIRPLDELERKAIIAYLAFPHRLYQFFKYVTQEQMVDEELKQVAKLQEELMKDELRKDFLRRLVAELNLELNLEV